jgi:archaellum component FlaC
MTKDEQIEKLKKEVEDLKKHCQMVEKLVELNMNDFWDIVDQRDWYYEECQRLKEKVNKLSS